MLEFNAWFFVLLINFLILLFILNKILYRPLLRVFKEREDAVEGSIAEAKRMDEEKNRLIEEYRKEISNASGLAKKKFEELRLEGIDRQKAIMEEANQKATSLLESARTSLRDETDKARKSLMQDVERFSDEIVRKLVGA